jgi:hypothetical protein
MQQKVLYVSGKLDLGGYLGIQLDADGCPMLHESAFVRVNGVPQTVDRGDNSGPGPFQGPCYNPGAFLFSLPDLGRSVTIEVGDRTQTVRLVVQPSAAGPVVVVPPDAATVHPGGEVVVPFSVADRTAPAPYAYGAFEEPAGADWGGPAVVRADGFHFAVPANAKAKSQRFHVQAGLVAWCENATCQTLSLQVGTAFQPPPADVLFPLTVAP